MAHVLTVDDDPTLLRALSRLLSRDGHTVTTAASGEAALATLGGELPDAVLMDVQMQGIDGLETLARIRRRAPALPVIIMTAQGEVDTAVRAFKLGATDFVVKPFVEAKLLGALAAAVEARRRRSEPGSPTLVGESTRFRDAMDLAVRLAPPRINILLEGETGTGKELFARAIHAASTRRAGPFVPVDCAILAENLIESELFGHEKGAFTGAVSAHVGHFERADGGTLFLDEVGNLSPNVQAKLLRALQERTIERVGGRETRRLDVRVVSAANVDLREAVRRGAFRMDLYYRLAEATVSPPPLRERRGDVRRLAEHFAARYSAQFDVPVEGVSPEALARLEAYDWPGNVRELEAVMKVAVVLAKDLVLPEHLPRWITSPSGPEPGWRDAAPLVTAGGTPAPPGTAGSTPAPPVAARQSPASSPPMGGGERLRIEIEVGPLGEGMDLKALTNAAGEQAERVILESMMQKGYTQVQLARVLNVDPKTLRGKLRKHGLEGGSE